MTLWSTASSEKQTRAMWVGGSRRRLREVGLRLHPDKTQDRLLPGQDGREDSYGCTSFTFLGFTFRKRAAPGRRELCSMGSFRRSATTR